MSGDVKRSALLTKSQPNLPLTHVEMPLAGPCSGATFRICRSFVQTSKLHPTPQYVQTVLVRRMREVRIADSASETLRIAPKPASGSTSFTTSIMPASAFFGSAEKNPACPSIDFSIKALQGQTVTQ